MLTFEKAILKLLNDYKAIIKKHLSRNEWIIKVNELGLKRKVLRHDNEVGLYNKAQRIIEDINHYLARNSNSVPSWHSGLDEFSQYLKNILTDYQIENNKIVHTSQQVSRALVEALQLVNLPNLKRTSNISRKLENCGQIIAKYGTREQQELFSKALKNFQHHDINFFLPLIYSFEKYLQEFAALFTNAEFNSEY